MTPAIAHPGRSHPMRIHRLAIAALFAMLPAAASAQAPSSTVHRPIQAQLAGEAERIARTYAALDRFSGSVLVARGGRELFSGGYGPADARGGAANTPETRFDLGSLGKQFTAAAILRLEAQGRLSVTDPLSRWLPEWPRDVADRVTLHHLLTHTAGIPSLGRRGELEDVEEDCNPQTLESLLAHSRGLPLQFTPGERFRYSNSGYMLLAAVVERAGGMPFGEYLRTALFTPAGMEDTELPAAPGPAGPADARGYAGYAPDVREAQCVHPTWHTGAGGVVSTVRDLHRWNRALREHRILPPEQLAKLFHPHVNEGQPGRDYAYGWTRRIVHERPAITHGGTTSGFVAEYLELPEDSLLVVVLSNRLPELGVNVPAQISRRIAAAALGRPYMLPPLPVARSGAELRRYAGRYAFGDGYVLEVEVRDGRLMAASPGDASWSLSTVAQQRALDPASDSLAAGMRALRAFAAGDVAALRGMLSARRAPEVTDEALLWLRKRIDGDSAFGPLLRMTPLRVIPDGEGWMVDARATFARGEWFIRAELDGEGALQGWYVGGTLPSVVELRPAEDGFFVDAFRWDEPDLRLRFVEEGGRVTALEIVTDAAPVIAPRIN